MFGFFFIQTVRPELYVTWTIIKSNNIKKIRAFFLLWSSTLIQDSWLRHIFFSTSTEFDSFLMNRNQKKEPQIQKQRLTIQNVRAIKMYSIYALILQCWTLDLVHGSSVWTHTKYDLDCMRLRPRKILRISEFHFNPTFDCNQTNFSYDLTHTSATVVYSYLIFFRFVSFRSTVHQNKFALNSNENVRFIFKCYI